MASAAERLITNEKIVAKPKWPPKEPGLPFISAGDMTISGKAIEFPPIVGPATLPAAKVLFDVDFAIQANRFTSGYVPIGLVMVEAKRPELEAIQTLQSKAARFLRGAEGGPAQALKSAYTDCLRFLGLLKAKTPTVIDVAADGEIVLEWRDDGRRATATFEGDGEFGYAMRRDGRFVPGAHQARVTDSLPEDLAAYLAGR
jgi:hypothetical protein